MNYYNFKIKERFINAVKTGTKQHEYRLATSERRQIRIGDVLILRNKSNLKDYVKARVKSIELYDTWEEPLKKYWEKDFQGVFKSLEQAISECYKFYSRDDVKKYGIIVFEIEPFLIELKGSNVLLDTNIVIHRESSNNIAYEVIQLYKSLDKLKVNKFVLEDIKYEIKKYKDKTVVSNMLEKLEAYNCLNSLNIEDDYFIKVVSKYSNNENSKIDNIFLYQIYKGRVDYLITDDKGILVKAKELCLDDCVLSSSEFLNLVEQRYPSFINYKALSINLCKMSSLDINDCFFDSLREDYEGIKFNQWFEKKSKSGEDAYVFKNSKGLQGFLYLKIEDEHELYNDINPIFEPRKRLKIGTFKINSTGLRVGERFLKIIFDYAKKSNVEEIYVTLFEGKRKEVKILMNLMMDWGFERHGYKESNGELVLVKKMGVYREDMSPKFNYPNIKPNPLYGVLPIDSQFHTDLFPDLYLKNESMTLFEEKPCGYAIEKIYVCGTKRIPVKSGDLMAIYYMAPNFYKSYNSVISGICILQEVLHPNTFEEYLKVCTNRSVFSKDQLEKFYYDKEYLTVLKVLFLKPLNNKIVLRDLYHHGIISEEIGPRITTTISNEKFKELLKIGGVDKL